MKRSWLIGAALVLSLTAVGCSDDEDDVVIGGDAGGDAAVQPRPDSGVDAGGLDAGHDASIDAGRDASIDSSTPPADAAVDSGSSDAAVVDASSVDAS